MGEETAAGDAKVAELEKKIDELAKQLKTYTELNQGSRRAIEEKARELDKASKAADIEGVSDAMLQELRADIKSLVELVKGIKEAKPERKGWF